MSELVLHFLAGFVLCFLGTLPFGPINLSVVKVTVDHGVRRGVEIAAAASLIEILQAAIAILFGMVISNFLENNIVLRFSLAVLFIILAAYIFSREPATQMREEDRGQHSWFRRGLVIAALNPQAIPFWIFALAAASQYLQLQLSGLSLLVFLLAVLFAKFAALYGFAKVSDYLSAHLQQSSLWINRLLAAVLLIIGLSQAWDGMIAVFNI